jgi:uncharacterized protein YjiS (DUF1127 family)
MYTLNQQYGDTSPLSFDWLARFASTIARLWFRSRQDRHVRLDALDDRMLRDIGLQRNQIVGAMPFGRQVDWYASLAGIGLTERHDDR